MLYVVCTYVYWNLCSQVQNNMNIKTYVKIFHRAKCYLQKLYKNNLKTSLKIRNMKLIKYGMNIHSMN